MDPEKPKSSFSDRRKSDFKGLSKAVEKNVSEFLSKPPIHKKVEKIKKFYHSQIGNDGSDKIDQLNNNDSTVNSGGSFAREINTVTTLGPFVDTNKSFTDTDLTGLGRTSDVNDVKSIFSRSDLSQISSSSVSHASSSNDSYCYSSYTYEEVTYEFPNEELEDSKDNDNYIRYKSSPPCLPPRNLPPRPSQEALSKLYETDNKLPEVHVPSHLHSPRPSTTSSHDLLGYVQHKQTIQYSSSSEPPPLPPKNAPLSWESTAPAPNTSRVKTTSFSQEDWSRESPRKLSPNTLPKQKVRSTEDIKSGISEYDDNSLRRSSQVLKTKVVKMAKTIGTSISSLNLRNDSYHKDNGKEFKDNISRRKNSNDSRSSKSSISSTSSRGHQGSDASTAVPARPTSELVQKLESALRSVPALMLVGHKGWLTDEPMYQFYAATANHTQINIDGSTEEDVYDLYQEWPEWPETNYYNTQTEKLENVEKNNAEIVRKSEIDTSDNNIMLTENRPVRTLWGDLQVVSDNPTTRSLSKERRKLQEIKFEILTTEVSYIKSLNVLQEHFIKSPSLAAESTLPKRERRILFQPVQSVRDCSLSFITDLEICWKESIFLVGIFDLILQYTKEEFNVYIEYCLQHSGMAEAYKTLMEQNESFVRAIKSLESHPGSCMLPLHSFLLLPLQRITRLLLLVEAGLQSLEKDDEEYVSCQSARNQLKQIVYDCNEGARTSTRRRERMAKLGQKMDYLPGVQPFSMTSASRWLIMSGDMTKYDWKTEEATFTLSRNKNKLNYKINKSAVCLFLFSDLLVLTRKKSDDSYTVLDYGLRTTVRADEGKNIEYLPQQFKVDAPKKYIMVISIFENHDKRYTEMVLSCGLESDRDRWLEAMTPHSVNDTLRTRERQTTEERKMSHKAPTSMNRQNKRSLGLPHIPEKSKNME